MAAGAAHRKVINGERSERVRHAGFELFILDRCVSKRHRVHVAVFVEMHIEADGLRRGPEMLLMLRGAASELPREVCVLRYRSGRRDRASAPQWRECEAHGHHEGQWQNKTVDSCEHESPLNRLAMHRPEKLDDETKELSARQEPCAPAAQGILGGLKAQRVDERQGAPSSWTRGVLNINSAARTCGGPSIQAEARAVELPPDSGARPIARVG
jgi:hypothetical protein